MSLLQALGERKGLPPQQMAEALASVGEHLAAHGETAAARQAYEHAAQGSGAAASNAALRAATLAAGAGEHWKAARLLLRALERQGGAETMRAALRELTALRLRRAEPVAYEAAYAAALAGFGYLETALDLGERLLPLVPEGEPLGRLLAERLDSCRAALVGYLQRSGRLPLALRVARRWVAKASGETSKARALAALARTHELAGDKRSLTAVLARLALEFPATDQGAWARRELLRLQTGGGK